MKSDTPSRRAAKEIRNRYQEEKMEPNVQREDEIEIDLMEICRYLLSKAGYILATGILFAVISLAVTVLFITPQYTSTTKMYILNRQTNDSLTSSDIQSSTYLTKDYMELIKSRTVIESVIAELKLDMDYEGLLSIMEVSTASDTRVVAINVTHPDPYAARDIANAIRIAGATHIQKVMNTEAVNSVDEANVPTTKSSPSLKKNVVIAAMLGILLAAAVFVVSFMMNDKVTTAEDVERYLGISVLGSMPIDEEQLKQKKARKKQKHKSGRK